jgi:hypothetical protein
VAAHFSDTIKFLFTDIEGSTELAQSNPDKREVLRGDVPTNGKLLIWDDNHFDYNYTNYFGEYHV